MSLINGDKARANRRRRARIKMRVKGREPQVSGLQKCGLRPATHSSELA
jgi:hypothetical protein